MKKIILIVLTKIFLLNTSSAQEYNASLFGCISDGITNNTSSIQYAIDFLAAKGGGKLNFFVGRYVTGGLKLKSNVTIELHEGAVLLASPNMNDYIETKNGYTFLLAEDISNFKLIGKGVLEIQSRAMENHLSNLNTKAIISFKQEERPCLLQINKCKDMSIDGIMFLNGGNAAVKIIDSSNASLQNLIIKSKSKFSSGIFLESVKNASLENIYVEVTNKPLNQLGDTDISKLEKCITPNGKSIL